MTCAVLAELLEMLRADWGVHVDVGAVEMQTGASLRFASSDDILDAWARSCVGNTPKPFYCSPLMSCRDLNSVPRVDAGRIQVAWPNYVATARFWLFAIRQGKLDDAPLAQHHGGVLSFDEQCTLMNVMQYMHLVMSLLTAPFRLSAKSPTYVHVPGIPEDALFVNSSQYSEQPLLLQMPLNASVQALSLPTPSVRSQASSTQTSVRPSQAQGSLMQVATAAFDGVATFNQLKPGFQGVLLWLKSTGVCACCGVSDPAKCTRGKGNISNAIMARLVRDLEFMGYKVEPKRGDRELVESNMGLLSRVYGACRVAKLEPILEALHGKGAHKLDHRYEKKTYDGNNQGYKPTAVELTEYLAQVRDRHAELAGHDVDGMLSLFHKVCAKMRKAREENANARKVKQLGIDNDE